MTITEIGIISAMVLGWGGAIIGIIMYNNKRINSVEERLMAKFILLDSQRQTYKDTVAEEFKRLRNEVKDDRHSLRGEIHLLINEGDKRIDAHMERLGASITQLNNHLNNMGINLGGRIDNVMTQISNIQQARPTRAT